MDAVSSNTKLGKAVKEAVEEMDALAGLVRACWLHLHAPKNRSLPLPCCIHGHCCKPVLASPVHVLFHLHSPPTSRQEADVLSEAEELLKKLGFKGTLRPPPQQEEEKK